ncbi:MAG: LysR family transcriptional regulator [Clostridia bacterium]|nr:LysR family transcriptional regulator [Clostridia bacterium]
MELLQLRYFFESAKTENFAETARKFQVPTTSVSASIKRLETELDCRLFDRVANRVTLNANGKRLQQSLCAAFSALDDAVDALTTHNADQREIRLLVRGMRRRITDLIIEYSTKHPHISFKTVFDFGETALEEYDIIIDEENDHYPDYERFELFTMRLHLKCSAGDPLCDKALQLRQLCNRPFISMGHDSNMHRILAKACNHAGFTPQVSVLCNDIECYEKLIASGLGIGVGRAESHHQGVKNLDVTDFNETYTVYAFYNAKAYYGNVKSFVDFLKNNS